MFLSMREAEPFDLVTFKVRDNPNFNNGVI